MSDDPFKGLTRHYDAEVVAKGGTSIFHLKPPTVLGGVRRDERFTRRAWDGHVEPSNYIAQGDHPDPVDDRVFG